MIPSHLLVKSFQPIIFIRKPRHTIRNLTLPNPFLSGATQFEFRLFGATFRFQLRHIIFNFQAKLAALSFFKHDKMTSNLVQMWFQSGATWTIWCDVPLDLMVWRVIYGIKIIISGQNMLMNPFMTRDGHSRLSRTQIYVRLPSPVTKGFINMFCPEIIIFMPYMTLHTIKNMIF